LIVIPKAILIEKLSCYTVFNFLKMKNVTIVLIFKFSICCAKPEGDKMSRNSTVYEQFSRIVVVLYRVYVLISSGTVWD
jgi:hypothetical protein